MERSTWPKNLSSSRKHEIKELLHGQNPTKKLRHLFDAHSQTGNDPRQPFFAEDLVVNVLGSFSNTLSLSSGAESYEVLQVRSNACVRSEVSEGSESIKSPVVPRKTSDTLTRLALNLIDDGWRIYHKSSTNSLSSGEFTVDDALKLQMEVQERLNQQLEVQKKLQVTLEAQEKHLQANLAEKAQKSLSLDGSDPANLEGARIQIVDLNLAITNFVDPAHGGGGGGGERNDSNIINMMMYERGGPQNHGSASQIYEGEAATLARSSSNPPQLILDSPSPGDDSIPLSFNSNPVFFDFLSVNQEQKLPSEDDLNPHSHSHDGQ